MKRSYKANASTNPPSAADLASDGYPSEGNAGTNTPATIVGPFWFHIVTEAIVTVCEEAGLVLSNDVNQFRDALKIVAAAQVPLATDDEHTQDNPPGNEAATPRGVKAAIDAAIAALVDGAPGALDTLNELAEALNDDEDFAATITAAVNARLTQAQGDARYARRDVVLASDVTLTAGTRVAQALSQSMDNFRWVEVLAGDMAGSYDFVHRIKRDVLGARVDTRRLLAMSANSNVGGGGSQLKLHSLNAATGVFTTINNNISYPTGSIRGLGLAHHLSELYALIGHGTAGLATVHSVNRDTGAMETIGDGIDFGNGRPSIGLASHGGTMYALVSDGSAVGRVRLWTIDVAAGTGAAVGAAVQARTANVTGLGLESHDGTLYAMTCIDNADSVQLYSVDAGTGVLTTIGPVQNVNSGSSSVGIGLSSQGGTLYAVTDADNAGRAQLHSVNIAAGALTAIGTPTQVVPPTGFSIFLSLDMTSEIVPTGFTPAGRFRVDRGGAQILGIEAYNQDAHIAQVLGIY